MSIDTSIANFLDYLLLERGLAKNTIDSYDNDLTEFATFLKKNKTINISDVSQKTILEYYKDIDRKQFSKATLQRRYSALNQFFKYLIRQKNINKNPMLSMRRQKKEFKLPKFLSVEEVEKILSVNNPENGTKQLRNRLILELLYSTGMRVSELCSLPIKSVCFNENDMDLDETYKFIVVKGKGQKERIVPLRKQIFPILSRYISIAAKKGQKYLFASTGKENHINRRTIENIIKESALKAGVNPEKVSPHTMRHSFATHLLQKGLDIREIQELLGHASIDTTAIYAKIDTKQVKEILEKYHPLGTKN